MAPRHSPHPPQALTALGKLPTSLGQALLLCNRKVYDMIPCFPVSTYSSWMTCCSFQIHLSPVLLFTKYSTAQLTF